MIEVKIEFTAEGLLKQYYITGHSDYAAKGSDIVCSAVSILAYSAYLAVNELDGIKLDFLDGVDELALSVDIIDNEVNNALKGITLYLTCGLKAIEKQYGKYININIIE